MTKLANLTPADLGILAVTLDDCMINGLGDDDIVSTLTMKVIEEDMEQYMDDAHDVAYKFFRNSFYAGL